MDSNSKPEAICLGCGEEPAIFHWTFNTNKKGEKKWYWHIDHCKKCRASDNLWRRFGIRQEDKNEIYKIQGGICPLFKIPITINGDAVVDHNHNIYNHERDGISTPEIRRSSVNGLLSQPANKVLGFLKFYHIDPLIFAKNIIRYENNIPKVQAILAQGDIIKA
jgi:hypothetical protein